MVLEIAGTLCRRPDIPSGNGLIFFGLVNLAGAGCTPQYVALCFIMFCIAAFSPFRTFFALIDWY